MEVITITTDAGYNRFTKKGYYAYRIRGNNLLLKGSGVFNKLNINGSTCAERGAIMVALWILKNNVQDFDLLVINRDNIHANKKDFNTELNKLLSEATKNFGRKKRKIQTRHVKAHSGTKEKRTYVHNWCDLACKKAHKDFIKNKK